MRPGRSGLVGGRAGSPLRFLERGTVIDDRAPLEIAAGNVVVNSTKITAAVALSADPGGGVQATSLVAPSDDPNNFVSTDLSFGTNTK